LIICNSCKKLLHCTYSNKVSFEEGLITNSLISVLGNTTLSDSGMLDIRVLSRGMVAPNNDVFDIGNINTKPDEQNRYEAKQLIDLASGLQLTVLKIIWRHHAMRNLCIPMTTFLNDLFFKGRII